MIENKHSQRHPGIWGLNNTVRAHFCKVDVITYSIFFLPGLRGAVAFALVLHLQLDDEKRHVLITSTLIIIMFTILCLGGSTLPLLKVN